MEPVNLTSAQAIAGLVGLGAALYVLVEMIKSLLGAEVTSGARWARLAPLIAPILGAALAPLVAQGWQVEGVPIPTVGHALAGVVAGWMSGGLYSTVAQTILGRDRRIEGR